MASDLPPSETLRRVLERCRIRTGAASAESAVMTHTALGGFSMPVRAGRFSVQGADEAALFAAIEACLAAGVPMALTERPDERGLPLIVDLDLRWDGPERQYTLEHIHTFVRTYTQVLLRYVSRVFDDAGAEHVASLHGLKWWVLEKRSPRPAKLDSTCVECKDGLHLVCTNVITPAIVQQQARREWLVDAENRRLLEKLSTGPADKVFDESVLSGRQQWFLYGSRKPEGDPHPWRVTHLVTEGGVISTNRRLEFPDGPPGESELALFSG